MRPTTEIDTLPKQMWARSKEHPDQIAIRAKQLGIWQVQTWKQFASEIRDIASGLRHRGLKRGDHVALLGDLDWRLFGCMTAIQSLGAVVVPIASDAGSRQICRYLSDSDVTMAIAEDQEQVDKLMDVKPECATLNTIVYIKHQGVDLYEGNELVSLDEVVQLGRSDGISGTSWFEARISEGSGDDRAVVFHELNEDGEQRVLGTTHNNWISAARNAAQKLSLKGQDELFCSIAPGFCWSILFYQVLHIHTGYRVSFPETQDTVQSDMREIGPTVCFMTPKAYKHMAVQTAQRMEDCFRLKRGLYQYCMRRSSGLKGRNGSQDRSSFAVRFASVIGNILFYAPLRDILGLAKARLVLYLADSVSPSVMDFYRALGVPVKQFYGPTVACGFLSIQGGVRHEDDNVGQPVDGMEIGISDNREVLLKGPHALAHGQVASETRVNSAYDEEWIRSGDAGYMDDDGTLRIVGRVREIGKLSDGTEFIPKIIERKALSCDYIKHAIAIGNDRPFVSMLMVLDADAIKSWAERNGVAHTSYSDLVSSLEVYELIRKNIALVNQELAREGRRELQVRRIALLTDELDICSGELSSHTRKACRAAIMNKYATLIDTLFSGSASDDRKRLESHDPGAGIQEMFISVA